MGRRYSHIPKYSVAKLIDAPVDENTHSKKNSKKTLKNSSKKLKKSAFFETLFAGNASKKEACLKVLLRPHQMSHSKATDHPQKSV